MKKTNRVILLLIFQSIVFSTFGQENKLYNYSNLNSTIITAEFLDEQMILKTVDENFEWEGSWRENNWHYFEFNQEIEIFQIEFGFYNSTCLHDCKLEFQLITKDTIIEVVIDSLKSIHELNISSDNLLINRKDVYPRGPGHISEIKIISSTKPFAKDNGSPTILLSKKKRLKIKYSLIEELDQNQIEKQIKIWNSRKKFYNRNIKKELEPHEKSFFENRIFYGNDEKLYCYKINSHTNTLNNKNLIELFDKCNCDIRELFFERKMRPTQKMEAKEFNFLGKTLSYNSDSTERILVDYLHNGDSWAGHAIPHICLMGKDKYINKIDSLQNDSNVFTQVQVINGLIYFNKPKKGLAIVKNIFKKEVESITSDSISIYGYYAWNSLQIMNEIYPNETLPMLLELYKKYRSLYPDEMNISDNWTLAYNYGTVLGKRVESFQGCDQSILGYIENYLNRFPHLSNNEILKEFKEYIKEKAVHNKRL